jgi:hypothetical protein
VWVCYKPRVCTHHATLNGVHFPRWLHSHARAPLRNEASETSSLKRFGFSSTEKINGMQSSLPRPEKVYGTKQMMSLRNASEARPFDRVAFSQSTWGSYEMCEARLMEL